MLKSLTGYDKRTAEISLSAYTSALLASPGYESDSQTDIPIDPATYERMKEEIHNLLKVTPTDLSLSDRARVFEFLAREMSEVALAGADIKKIKDRIGERGILRPDLYEIIFRPTGERVSERVFEFFGVRERHIIEGIRHADLVEEFNFEVIGTAALHVKMHHKLSERDRFSLLILTLRKGARVFVQAAWRVYHADVGVSAEISPMSLLKAFIETYGIAFSIDGTETKFILATNVEQSPGTPVTNVIRVDHASTSVALGFGIVIKSSFSRLHQMAFVFVINRFAYAADLRKRGVHVENVEDPSTLPMGWGF